MRWTAAIRTGSVIVLTLLAAEAALGQAVPVEVITTADGRWQLLRSDEPGMWVGVAWQHPVNDWGDLPGGFDLTGAKKITFWARGEDGGEELDFGVGIIGSDKDYPDTAKAERKGVKLKREWKRYSIDLGDEDLSRVKTPFAWFLGGQGRTITFYLDDIRFE